MIYRILRLLLRHALHVFFRRLEITGLEEVPPDGPLLLAANHPNTLIDVLLIATCLERRVGFVAKATLFENPLANALLRYFGAVPVHRRQDGASPEAQEANRRSLAACEEAVASGRAILIFPEGVSQDAPRLQRLKTGLARIALAAEEQAPGQVMVVPVALAYDAPGTFRSRARVVFSPPIRVAPFRRAEEGFAQVRALTEAVRGALAEEVVHVADPEHDPLLSELDALYGGRLQEEAGGRLAVVSALARAVNHFAGEDPARVERFRADLGAYRQALAAAGLDDAAVRERRRSASLGQNVAYWLGAPLAWWGIVNHLLLYHLPRVVLGAVPVHRVYHSTVKLGVGLLALFACYGAQGVGLHWAAARWAATHGASPLGLEPLSLALIYVGTLPLCGLIALAWWEGFLARRRRHAVQQARRSVEAGVLSALVTQREALIAELEEAQAEFLAARPGDEAPSEGDEPF